MLRSFFPDSDREWRRRLRKRLEARRVKGLRSLYLGLMYIGGSSDRSQFSSLSSSMMYILGCVESLSLLCMELVESEARLRLEGTEDSRLGGLGWGSMSSGTTGHNVRRLCLTASQPCCFSMSQP